MNLERLELHDQVRGYQVFRRIIVSDPCNKPSSQCSINNIPSGHSQIHTWSPMLLRLIYKCCWWNSQDHRYHACIMQLHL